MLVITFDGRGHEFEGQWEGVYGRVWGEKNKEKYNYNTI